jgi:plasmid stabilization system protein ParE
VERLADFPRSGRVVPEIEDPAIREILHSASLQSATGAERLGVTRQSVIKMWIAERLERKAS